MNMEARPAPFAKETQPKPEKLLSETTTGGQALVLLGIEPPQQDRPILLLQEDQKKQLFKSATEGIPADHKKRLTTASLNEREEFWKDTPEAQRMETWRKSMNGFLDRYTKDQTKTTEQSFLKHILKSDTLDMITADTLYGTFMQGEGKGDVEFFARRIAETSSIEEIEKNREFIAGLGKIYGENSAKIGELLSYGIANARHNLDKFIASAQENLNKRAYGEDVWTPLAQNASRWDEKRQTKRRQPMQPSQPVDQTPQSPQPEASGDVEEYHPLVADARDASEKDLNKSAPNQDARFVDRKHGAFGVFDGLGGNIQGEVASSTASKYIEDTLAQIPANLPLDKTEEAVQRAISEASEKLWEINEPRYTKLREEYEKKRAPQPLSPDDRAEIDSKSIMATTAAVVKLWQETEPDGTLKPGGAKKAIIAWAGDSRVYLFRGGTLERLTIDDTPLRDLVSPDVAKDIHDKKDAYRYKRQEMQKTAVVITPLNPADKLLFEEIKRNPRGIMIPADPNTPIEVPYAYFDNPLMTKTLAMDHLKPNGLSVNIESGDKFIITSDGVHDYSLSSEMADTLNNPDNAGAAKAAEALVKFAKKGEAIPGIKVGRPQDDTTAVVVEIK